MAEDDIYGSKAKYELFKDNYEYWLSPKGRIKGKRGKERKYICVNPSNFVYFKKLMTNFEARDISYIRRIRVLQSMKLICYSLKKELEKCTREDINELLARLHEVYKTPISKSSFIKDVKFIWKNLFPEKDEKGRADETMIPYVVRHLKAVLDKSKLRLRSDKLTLAEFEEIVNYFGHDKRMQAYLTLALESLGRPQEILYRRIGNVELYDNYAKIYITEHGKEGPGLLQCIDSYPYLLKWLQEHPFKGDKNAYLFVNIGNTNRGKPLKPTNINKMMKVACKELGIEKPITCYSLKRNGVTIRRLRGDSDMEIQHAARWTSSKQLKTYDLSNQNEAFDKELEKRGLLRVVELKETRPKICGFCNRLAGFGDIVCAGCMRPLDRKKILEEQERKDREIIENKEQIKQEVTNEILKRLSENKVIQLL